MRLAIVVYLDCTGCFVSLAHRTSMTTVYVSTRASLDAPNAALNEGRLGGPVPGDSSMSTEFYVRFLKNADTGQWVFISINRQEGACGSTGCLPFERTANCTHVWAVVRETSAADTFVDEFDSASGAFDFARAASRPLSEAWPSVYFEGFLTYDENGLTEDKKVALSNLRARVDTQPCAPRGNPHSADLIGMLFARESVGTITRLGPLPTAVAP